LYQKLSALSSTTQKVVDPLGRAAEIMLHVPNLVQCRLLLRSAYHRSIKDANIALVNVSVAGWPLALMVALRDIDTGEEFR
jgi:hypothetical protein